MRRTVTVALAVAGACLTLAACGPDTSPTAANATPPIDHYTAVPPPTFTSAAPSPLPAGQSSVSAPAPPPPVTVPAPTTVVAPPPPPPAPAPAPKPEATPDQQRALQDAQEYLSVSSFSRSGLIGQVKYDGFSTADATWAVDHVSVDWNEQAVKSAKQYLSISSFSRSGLVAQLEYDGFTSAQAQHGVDAAY